MPLTEDTNPFQRMLIDNKITGGAIITWEMSRHFVDTLPWYFQLQYSPGELKEASDWIDVGNPISNTFSLTDPEQRTYGKSLELAYRVKLTTPRGVYYATPSLLRKWNKHDWCIVREMVRKEELLNRVFISVEGYYLKAKRYGIPCTASLDPLTGEILDSNCPLCKGTGFITGYYAAMPTVYADVTNSVTREHRGERGTEKQDVIYGRFIDFPTPTQADAWINKATDERYYIHTIKELGSYRGYAFIWQVELRLAPFSDILYTVPLEGLYTGG